MEKKRQKKTKTLVKGLLMWRKIYLVSGDLSRQGIVSASERFSIVF